MPATIAQYNIHDEAMCDSIRDVAIEKFHPGHAWGDFVVCVPHANESDYLPTFIPLVDIGGTGFRATLLRFDRGTGFASYGVEVI